MDAMTVSTDRVVLEGDLQNLPVAELLQFFHLQGKDGLLRIVDDDGKPSAVIFYEGRQVVHALCRGVEGAEAVYAAVAHRSGTFQFVATERGAAVRTVSESVQNLILEGLRRVEEMSDVFVLLPPDEKPLFLAPEPPQDDIRLTAKEWSILSLVNGKRTIGEIVAASKRPSRDVRAILSSLLAADLVVDARSDSRLDEIVPCVAKGSAPGAVRFGAPTLLGTLLLKKVDGKKTLRQLIAELAVAEAEVQDDLRLLVKSGRLGFTSGEEAFRAWCVS